MFYCTIHCTIIHETPYNFIHKYLMWSCTTFFIKVVQRCTHCTTQFTMFCIVFWKMFPVIFDLMLYNIFQLNCTMFISVCTTLYIEIIIDKSWYDFFFRLYNLMIMFLERCTRFLQRFCCIVQFCCILVRYANNSSYSSPFWMRRSRKISAWRPSFGNRRLLWGAWRQSSPSSRTGLKRLRFTVLASKSFSAALRRAKIIWTHRHKTVYSFHPQLAIAIARRMLRTRSRAAPDRWGGWGEGWRQRPGLQLHLQVAPSIIGNNGK